MDQDTLYYILRHILCSGVKVWKGCKICWCALTNCWDSKKMMMFAYEWEPAGTEERYSKSAVASLSFNRIYNSNGILKDISNGLANPENSVKLSNYNYWNTRNNSVLKMLLCLYQQVESMFYAVMSRETLTLVSKVFSTSLNSLDWRTKGYIPWKGSQTSS